MTEKGALAAAIPRPDSSDHKPMVLLITNANEPRRLCDDEARAHAHSTTRTAMTRRTRRASNHPGLLLTTYASTSQTRRKVHIAVSFGSGMVQRLKSADQHGSSGKASGASRGG